ncbi:protein MEI2-like 1 isoform X1 [Zea mays]|nr:Protein MEI2-like 1 [Zea mays]XP_008681183.1 protein MEI2-like 1 isoform X1 [Zea mays]AQK71257.1 Protein MEI2-like 1 [Zea mays]AQK71259.1 Protein MEI2-like 1 [Zea mays]AQK71260.1 Protein MEI2-like 1 [Zea mays]AQK71261.1 Protein MEI2-like 1 [Zea mays]AQK71263.1 Protein MEI2-like 1 [Zea mays]|eukprot:XP_008681182.1 protein MEI2-like 1 isoform X1 [Zea mays]
MPSQVMDPRRHLSQFSNPTVAASSFSEEQFRLPTERQVGFWKQESLHHIGSKSVASSPIEKPQPIGTKTVGRVEPQPYKLRDQKTAFSLEHKTFGQERHVNLPPSLWRADQDPNLQSDPSLFPDGRRTSPNEAYNENGLFSSSLSEIFDRKLGLRSMDVRLRQPVQKVDLTHVDDEPFELTEEIEAQIIGNILPDDDDLLSDVLDVGYTAHANMGDDVDDDIFYTGGGMELETDENKKNTELNGANDGLGLLNGTMNGEHPYGEHPSRTLFVRNINSSVEDSELKLLFENYGEISNLYTACKHRGFVMISYYDIRSAWNAMRALQNKPLRRRKLDIHYSIPKDNPSEKDINQGMLVVFNVDPSITNNDIHQIFSEYGDIKEIRDAPQKGHHKIIEFYDVRAAEGAARALNRSDLAGKKIKLETGRLSGARRSTQHMSKELGQEEFGVCKLGSPSTNSPSLPSLGSSNIAAMTSCGRENGSMHGLHSGLLTSMSPFREASFLGLSSTLPQSLSSPIGIASAATHSNQAPLGELSHSLSRMNGHVNYGFQGLGAIHPHSLPDVHNGANNGTPYNLNTITPVGVNKNSRTAEAVDSRHLHKVGSGNLNGHSFDRAGEGAMGFSRSGSGHNCGHQLMWNNSNNFHGHPNSPVLWQNPGSFVNNVPSRPPAQMHGVPRAPSHMIENVLPMHHHHVGSAPAINPSLWDRRHGYAGDLTEASSFHPGSVGSMGFPGSPQLHGLELNSIFSHTGGSRMDPTVSSAQISAPSQQRGPMFHGRNPMVPLPSFDSPGERMRSRRNDSGVNQSDNKRQYELDVDRIMRGEDSRTTLMIKNIPNKYTSKMLLAAIDESHKGTYDFIYLPIDFKNKCNVGYAFINMTNPQHIIPFYQSFNGKKWEKFNSEKVASLAYARIQGKTALIAHFQNSSLMNEDKRCRPILFHSDGPNAGDQEPFPMGSNIRARSGRSRTSSGEENHHDIQTVLTNGDTSSNGADNSGPTKDTE